MGYRTIGRSFSLQANPTERMSKWANVRLLSGGDHDPRRTHTVPVRRACDYFISQVFGNSL